MKEYVLIQENYTKKQVKDLVLKILKYIHRSECKPYDIKIST